MNRDIRLLIEASQATAAYSFDQEMRGGKNFAEALQGFFKTRRRLRRALRPFEGSGVLS